MTLLLYCYIIFSASGCQVNGDPAPGRSPGPPIGNVDTSHAFSKINLEQTMQNNGTFEFNENANNTDLSNIQQSSEEKIIKSSNKLKTFINQINISKFNNQRKSSENLRSESDKNIHCKSVDAYVDGEEKIVQVERGNDEKISVPIKFDVIHDLFDTQRGLINGLIYTGESSQFIFSFFCCCCCCKIKSLTRL